MSKREEKSKKISQFIDEDESSDEQSIFLPSGAKRIQRRRKSRICQDGKLIGFEQYTWSLQENILYKNFLKNNLLNFQKSNREKKMMKINVQCSKWVKTRSPIQCRSHHQKMLKYKGDISSIIASIEVMEIQSTSQVPLASTQKQSFDNSQSVKEVLKEIEFVPFVEKKLWDQLVDQNKDIFNF